MTTATPPPAPTPTTRQRRRDKRGRYSRGNDQNQTKSNDLTELTVAIYAMLATIAPDKLDPKIHKRLNGFLRGQSAKAERTHFIKFAIGCGVCIVISNGSGVIVDGAFMLRYNMTQARNWWPSCQANPWDCIRGKIRPAFNLGAKPTDNVTAMLDLVAWAEGTDDRYDISYTGPSFPSFTDHPRKLFTANGVSSDAAGRYQFLSPTWDSLKAKLNLRDFSPGSQDRAAIQLMKDSGCYGAAVRGDVVSFTDRCWSQWASLQSQDGQKLDARQRSHPIGELQAKYQEFLGTRAGTEFTKPLPRLTVTSPFLPSRIHPVTHKLQPHNGIDLACAVGEPVMSPISGTFRRGNSDPDGFGNTWGRVESPSQNIIIGHTRKLWVMDGQSVTAGQPIAECGAEGSSTGPHLHLEVWRQGQLIDPQTLLGINSR